MTEFKVIGVRSMEYRSLNPETIVHERFEAMREARRFLAEGLSVVIIADEAKIVYTNDSYIDYLFSEALPHEVVNGVYPFALYTPGIVVAGYDVATLAKIALDAPDHYYRLVERVVEVEQRGREDDFQRGLEALTKLAPKVWLCKAAGSAVSSKVAGVTTEEFAGKHPAGLVGTHIHLLDPVSRKKTVWHLHYQDVLAIGHLFGTGKLDVQRVIALAGPPVKRPRLLRTRMGAQLSEILAGELSDGELRVISGDVLSGRIASGELEGFLSRHDLQISVLREDRAREFIGWLLPGGNKFSTVWAYLGGILPGKKFEFTTTTHGEHRDMVPIGMYERVMPLDILPTFLLRALLTRDLERAEKLGALELDPEDLGLCSFVCPGKQDYGVELRATLDTILKEG